jgi:PHD/YefM family antitoxin component YafN of YafNO toxin-antitoxin module
MYTTYHLQSAADLNNDIIKAIKTAFKGKSIVVTIEEDKDETTYLLSNPNNKEMLLKSIQQANNGEFISFKPSK